jgi:hypothetical protein
MGCSIDERRSVSTQRICFHARFTLVVGLATMSNSSTGSSDRSWHSPTGFCAFVDGAQTLPL